MTTARLAARGGSNLRASRSRQLAARVAVVGRWYGGVNIGPARFTHIQQRATLLLRAVGHTPGGGFTALVWGRAGAPNTTGGSTKTGGGGRGRSGSSGGGGGGRSGAAAAGAAAARRAAAAAAAERRAAAVVPVAVASSAPPTSRSDGGGGGDVAAAVALSTGAAAVHHAGEVVGGGAVMVDGKAAADIEWETALAEWDAVSCQRDAAPP